MNDARMTAPPRTGERTDGDRDGPDPGAAAAALRAMRDGLAARMVEREVECELLALCLVAQVHLVLVGEPGVAKTEVARRFASGVAGARYFETQLAPDTPAGRLVGPYSLRALDQGRFEFETAGMLPEANLALLDEGFRANSACLDNLLAILNERVFHNGPRVQQVPLWTLVIACNELPAADQERTAAFRDRLAVTRLVRPVRSDQARRAVICAQLERRRGAGGGAVPGAAAGPVPVGRAEVEMLQAACGQVACPEPFLEAALRLWRLADDHGYPVSPRRFGELVKLAQARALLADRAFCLPEDLTLAEHVLWLEAEDESGAAELALQFAGEARRRRGEIEAALEEIGTQLAPLLAGWQAVPLGQDLPPGTSDQATGFVRRIAALRAKGREAAARARAAGEDPGPLEALDRQAEALAAEVSRAGLGIGL